MNAKGGSFGTALSTASCFGYEKIVEILLDAGADVNADEDGSTVIHEATTYGHEKIVKILLDAGADVNADKENVTALQLAS